MDLFSEIESPKTRKLKDYIDTKDTKGAINYLSDTPIEEAVEEVLRAGLSTIGTRAGKKQFISHVAEQLVCK